MSLSAAQLIYTNVEKKLSAHGRDGYQIWLCTPDVLDEGEEIEIQNRLGDFEERRDNGAEPLVRHLYFALPSGRVVIARSVPLAQTDKFHRAGRFYAHAFVLEPDVFRRLENDPFALLDQVTFQSTIEDGLKAGDPGNGSIPVALLDAKPAKQLEPALPHDRLAALLPAVLRACGKEKPVIIGVPGAPSRLLQLLRDVIPWLPPALRRSCSFDTLSNGRNLTQAPFAFVGLPAAGPPRRYLNLLTFDPVRQALLQPLPAAAIGTFDQWLAHRARAETPPPLVRSDAAYRLGACLDRAVVGADDLEDVDESLFAEIAGAEAGVPKLERLLRGRLRADCGEVLEPLMFALAWNWLRSGGLAGLRTIGRPLEPALLLRWLLAVYEQRSAAETQREAEVPALKDLLERAKNVEGEALTLRKRLVLIMCRWAWSWGKLARFLRDPKMIPDEMYQWFVEWALRTVPARVGMGVGPSAGGAWCGPEVSAPGEHEEECQRLVGAILGMDLESGEDNRTPLPPERWEWIFFYLQTLVRREEPE